ncbi:MAG: ABC transporter ATP-binding protein [Clostridia bacterium]
MIDVRDISKVYGTGDSAVYALDHVSLSVASGELCAIVGQSGSGKSTLMNVLGCLDVPTSGEYLLRGVHVGAMSRERLSVIRGREIGFVFQGFHLLPRMSALQNVELPLVYAGVPQAARRARALSSLLRVGLGNRVHHKPCEMSGGQQQRVAIARALVCNPSIILADEPTGNLDRSSGDDVLNLLCELNHEGTTVLLITHDMQVAARAPRVVSIADGHIVSDFSSKIQKE